MKKVASRLQNELDHLNQTGMASKAGVDQKTISNWARGKIPKQWKALVELSNKLGKSTDYLLGLTDTPHRVDNNEPPEMWEVREVLVGLSERRRKLLVRIAEVMLEDQKEFLESIQQDPELQGILDLIEGIHDIETRSRAEAILKGAGTTETFLFSTLVPNEPE